MKLHQVRILFIAAFPLILGGGCQPSGSIADHEAIDPGQVTNAVMVYRIMDQQTLLFDSVILPSPIVDRFIQAWNISERAEMMKFVPSFIIKLQLKDNTRRSFRLNGNYAKEQTDWSFPLRDTTIQTSLDSLRAFHERWSGIYETGNNAQIALHRNGAYAYSFNQCTRGEYSHGTWTTSGDTLRLRADPDSLIREDALLASVQFKKPFVLMGRQLYFNVEGDFNHHHSFSKK